MELHCPFLSLQRFPLSWRKSQLLPRKQYVLIIQFILQEREGMHTFRCCTDWLCPCSWPLRKAVWAHRRWAARTSQSWRRRLKLWTSSGSRRRPPLPARRILSLMSPCEHLHFSLLHFNTFLSFFVVRKFLLCLAFFFLAFLSTHVPPVSRSVLRPCDWPTKIWSSRGK